MAEAGEPVLEVAARYQGQRQKGSAPVFLLKFRDMQALPASQALPVNAVQAVAGPVGVDTRKIEARSDAHVGGLSRLVVISL